MVDEKLVFEADVVLQQEDGAHINRMLVNFKKAPKDRNTLERIQKLSADLVGVWKVVAERHERLCKSQWHQESIYCSEKMFTDIEVDKNTLLGLLKAEEDKLGKCVGNLEKPTTGAQVERSQFFRKFYCEKLIEIFERFETAGRAKLAAQDLEFILEQLDKNFTEFSSFHEQVRSVVEDSSVQAALISDYESIKDRYQLLAVTMEEILAGQQQYKVEEEPTLAVALKAIADAFQSQTNNRSKHEDVHLPKITLPTFDGTLSQWPDFKDLFESMIHNRSSIAVVQKMTYLKSCLKEAAAESIKSFRLSQYSEAWELLNRRYNNPKLLIYDCFKRLMTLKPVQMERSSDLRKLIDTFKELMFSLKSLGEPVEQMNSFFVYLLSSRLPSETYAVWEQSLVDNLKIPLFDSLDNFLESRIHTLQSMEKRPATVVKALVAVTPPSSSSPSTSSLSSTVQSSASKNVSTEKKSPQRDPCAICTQNHATFRCPSMVEFTPSQRLELVGQKKLCELCFQNHPVSQCKYTWRCRLCKGLHNTLLHSDSSPTTIISSNCGYSSARTLLATAIVNIGGVTGERCNVRCLIDNGSMASFVSESLAQKLQLPRNRAKSIIDGLGETPVSSRAATTITFGSVFDKTKLFSVDAWILKKLTRDLPQFNCSVPNQFDGLIMADPNFRSGGRVDVILGADIYHALIMDGIIPGDLLGQKTQLGWIVSGKVDGETDQIACYSVTSSEDDLDSRLKNFWESEEKLIEYPPLTVEQIAAEQFYITTTTRDETGRYICRLPLKPDAEFGDSRRAAIGCFYNLERRFKTNPDFKSRYVGSMKEYFSLGHAVPALGPDEVSYFNPHLAVIKDESLTTKTRVVFNASHKSSNGKSLNDNLLVGPVIQRDLVEKLIRFRMSPFVFICDIEKMYRQIRIHPDDWKFQRFVWREDESAPLGEYHLTTVTFGQASAPFTATRTLKQLAEDHQTEFPVASRTLQDDCYVDDIHFGAESVEILVEGKEELIKLVESASFSLRKWASNCDKFTNTLPPHTVNSAMDIKFMGVIWNRLSDHLSYPAPNIPKSSSLSKREMLSVIAGIFDPLGWVQPIVVRAKILMQSLWKLNLDWNANVPEDLLLLWNEIVESLNLVNTIQIPRWTNSHCLDVYELHGFADASQTAYGAAIYLKVNSTVQLICSKSRVAPMKIVSIPRLELKGAVLMTDLLVKVAQAMSSVTLNLFGWCDSKVVLHWIGADPSRWKPFIRNRVAKIQEDVPKSNFFYVKSSDNPADLVSRGCDWETLCNCTMWFNGPAWLRDDARAYNQMTPSDAELEIIETELLKSSSGVVIAALAINSIDEGAEHSDEVIDRLINYHSSFYRLCRVVAWMTRHWRNRLRRNAVFETDLTIEEVRHAEIRVLVHVQSLYYAEEVSRLKSQKMIRKDSRITNLNPFIDSDGIMRVGGRLEHATVPYDMKHPIILPTGPALDHLLWSIVMSCHRDVMHGGVQLTISCLRNKFWIVKGMEIVKRILRSCVICHRQRPCGMTQLMANLPPARVQFCKSFLHCGLDFAGPITMKNQIARGGKTYKAYICVFVCLATKAIHLELVTSLSTDGLIAALRRFVSFRGRVDHLYSDNGTNNVGAFRKLNAIQEIEKINMKWSFIPPASPHFGGLWEAGVKSVKSHLRKVLADNKCTYEELLTVLAQVMAVLNSRPLCPVSDDVNDLNSLTPAHFLTGQQFVPIPEDSDRGRLSNRWDHIQCLYRQICTRYKQEYLSRLQQRPKWLKKIGNVEVGQLVLIKEENIAATNWPLGRVMEVHPGSDGLVRVVTVKTEEGIKKRPICKISPLPIDTTERVADAKAIRSSPRLVPDHLRC